MFFSNCSFGQQFLLSEKGDSISSYDNNKKFMVTVNKQYDKLIKEKADSILLYYEIEYSSNYAIIFWEKNGVSQTLAFYQYNPPKDHIGKEVLKNEILRDVNFKSIYNIFKNNEIRTIDTNIVISHDNPVYCQFYFRNKKQLYAGYRSKVNGMISLDFANAYADEESQIVNRELKKSHIPKMQQ
jgi:hypothetical protein